MSEFMFTLQHQIPSGKNQVSTAWIPDKKRPGKMKPCKYPNKRFKEWRKEALAQMDQCSAMLEGRIEMIVDYVPGDLRTRDISGMLDALFSLIVTAGVLADDKQIRNVNWHEFPMDRQYPKCRVMLRELNPRV